MKNYNGDAIMGSENVSEFLIDMLYALSYFFIITDFI